MHLAHWRNALGTDAMHLEQRTWHRAPAQCTWHYGTMPFGAMHLDLARTWHNAPDTGTCTRAQGTLAQCTWAQCTWKCISAMHLAHGTMHLAQCTWHSALSTTDLAQWTWRNTLGTTMRLAHALAHCHNARDLDAMHLAQWHTSAMRLALMAQRT